jgi:hypothetical protein
MYFLTCKPIVAVRRYAGGSEQLVLYDLLLDFSRGRALVEKLEKRVGLREADGEQKCTHYLERSGEVTRQYDEMERRIAAIRKFLHEVSKTP